MTSARLPTNPDWLEEATAAWRGMVVQLVSAEAERVRHTLPRPGRLSRPGLEWKYQMREIFDNMNQQMENVNKETRALMEQKLQESDILEEDELVERISSLSSSDEEEGEHEDEINEYDEELEEGDVFEDWDWCSGEWDEENKIKTIEESPDSLQLKFYDQPRGSGVWSGFHFWQVDLVWPVQWGAALTVQISREDNILIEQPTVDSILMSCMDKNQFSSLESFILSSSFNSSSKSRKMRKRMRIFQSASGLDMQMVMKGSWKIME